jgi:hypothetical protein
MSQLIVAPGTAAGDTALSAFRGLRESHVFDVGQVDP